VLLLQEAGKGCTLLQILSMRSLILALTPVLLSATVSAQGVFSNKTQSILEKVIQDYPNHFYNIKGELVSQAHQATEYRSTVQLPGAASSTITFYTATHMEGYGWNCTVLETPDFERAVGRFKEIYGQLSNSIITTSDQKTYILPGQYEAPFAGKKCTRIVFTLLPGVAEAKKLKVYLCLREEEKEWKIVLRV